MRKISAAILTRARSNAGNIKIDFCENEYKFYYKERERDKMNAVKISLKLLKICFYIH